MQCAFQDDFEDYSDDFEEDSETDSDRIDIEGKSKTSGQNSELTRNLNATSGKDPVINTTNNESYSDSPLLHRIMNRRRSNDNIQPLQVVSFIISLSDQSS